MSRQAFFIAGDRVVHIANPCGAGVQYHAQPQVLDSEAPVGPFRHETAETIILVREGVLEVMINGAVGWVSAGSFVRVPVNTWYGYRSSGNRPAQLLIRTAPAQRMRDSCKITIKIAAA